MHYGWPDGLDIWSSAFVERFAHFGCQAAGLIAAESDEPTLLSLVNMLRYLLEDAVK